MINDFEQAVTKLRKRLTERETRRQLQRLDQKDNVSKNGEQDSDVVPWSWVFTRLLVLLGQYPSGLTEAIVNAELEVQWDECSAEVRRGVSKRFETLDAFVDGKAVPPEAMFEVVTLKVQVLPGTRTHILSVGTLRVQSCPI
ncbi:uncharacterized protein SPPG_05065 [Spizellomyces punctatus DAOM BR117]|uniref:Cell division control protein 24 OB domain-containing protein n=1 Tax=Spizellomyces punctatus (strain DAOM BR117) TaxID=645134 RepID=A0A0L0HFJ5_SPIPD|nr:uncharacterized protein SPPG_05065 [Spizellomyces punctatus DAOM BR117]KNC99684.1 hypothetical protein SPPG_05065 [Spizellomyces punctatus DAOM BR117]|eukprot:XP_016607724.1 hypothetical protein SPPG_05065 [Spizellomyces punctatus DAOM BR117]